jgi:hypothetical protein
MHAFDIGGNRYCRVDDLAQISPNNFQTFMSSLHVATAYIPLWLLLANRCKDKQNHRGISDMAYAAKAAHGQKQLKISPAAGINIIIA